MATAVVFFVGENMATEKKQHSEELKEKILAEIATGVPMTQLSKKYKIPVSTMGTWKTNARTKSDEFENLRKERKEQFINKAWNLIEKAQSLMEKNLDSALMGEEKIDVGKLSTVVGTMYDKQALASDEATENVKVKLEDFF